MSEEKEIIKRFVQEIIEQKNKKARIPDKEELEAIAAEIGISDKDLNNIDTIVDQIIQRAQGYINHELWNYAIDELKDAAALRPGDKQIEKYLARSYLGKYRAKRKREDKEKAKKLIQAAIEKSPGDSQLYTWLGELEQKKFSLKKQLGPYLQPFLLKRIIFFLIIAIVAGALTYFTLFPQIISPWASNNKNETSGTWENSSSGWDVPEQIDIPIVQNIEDEGLELEVRTNEISDFGDSFSYTLTAVIFPIDQEIHELELELALIGENEQILYSRRFDARASYQASVRPGEALPFNQLVYQDTQVPDIQECRLTFVTMEAYPASDEYPDSKSIQLSTSTSQSALQQLSVLERENTVQGLGNETVYNTIVFTVINSGSTPISRLQLEIDWLDGSGNIITTEQSWVVTASSPVMMPEEARSVKIYGDMPAQDYDDVQDYRVNALYFE
ncbi:MAG: tetratricopeptide repeat protein [Spirochaetia bacterium]